MPDGQPGEKTAHGWCLGSRITQNSGGDAGAVGGSGGLDASSGAGGAGGLAGAGGKGRRTRTRPIAAPTPLPAVRSVCRASCSWTVTAATTTAIPARSRSLSRALRRAMLAAKAGQIVNFNTGTYGVPTGDDFREQIPQDVTLRNKLPTISERVVFKGGTTSSLIFAGGGGLNDINLEGFQDPIKATAGHTVPGQCEHLLE